MTTPTTTYPLIRDQWISTIKGLTPSFRPLDLFTLRADFDEQVTFIEWCESASNACFRNFIIERTGERGIPPVTDWEIEQHTQTAELFVAYPKEWGLYDRGSNRALLDLEDVMDTDGEQINAAIGIGGAGNYLSGQSYCSAVMSVEHGENVVFAVFELEAIFYRAV